MITPLTRVPLATNGPHLSTSHFFLFLFIFFSPNLPPQPDGRGAPAAQLVGPPAAGLPPPATLRGPRRPAPGPPPPAGLRGPLRLALRPPPWPARPWPWLAPGGRRVASPASSARRSRGRPRLLRSPPRPARLLCLPPRPAPRAVAPASTACRRRPGLLRPSPSPSPWPSPRPSPSRPPVTEPRRRKRGWTRPLDFGGRVGPGSEPNIPSGSDPTPSNLHPNIRKRGSTHPGWTLPFNQTHG